MKYYGVVASSYCNGHIEAYIVTEERDEKPLNTTRGFTDCDEYTVWFEDADDAQNLYEELIQGVGRNEL